MSKWSAFTYKPHPLKHFKLKNSIGCDEIVFLKTINTCTQLVDCMNIIIINFKSVNIKIQLTNKMIIGIIISASQSNDTITQYRNYYYYT